MSQPLAPGDEPVASDALSAEEVQQRIVACLREHGPLHRERISRYLQINESRINRELQPLRSAGRVGIKKQAHGPRWFLIEVPR